MRRAPRPTTRPRPAGAWPLAALLAGACSGRPAPEPAGVEAAPELANGDQRLSPDVVPLRYRLHFDLDPARESYAGTTDVRVRVDQPTRTLRLHALGLELSKTTLTGSGLDGVSPRVTQGDQGALSLELPEPVQGEIELHFEYRAGLEQVPDSLYRARAGDEWYAFTQFEAQAAREAFPCFDEPRFKTPYVVSVTAPSGLVVAANAPLASSAPEGDHTRHQFAETPPLPSYLVALTVGAHDVVEAEEEAAGVPLRILAPRGKGDSVGYALSQTGPILESLVDYFGRAYPYAKLDMVAVPSFRAGAMENAGLVTYRERLLVMDEKLASPQDLLSTRTIVAHELAHMWFGNLVTMQWWDDLWLNEAFATWMADKVMSQLAPETEPQLRAVQSKGWVMNVDSLDSATPIRKQIRHSGDVRNAFDAITYRKGQAVLTMLESWVGETSFRRGIRAYLDRHAWGNATAADLLSALDAASAKDVSRVGRSFVEHAGVPLLDASWSCEAGSVRVALSQRRYRLATSDASGARARDEPWAIPICLTLVNAAGGEVRSRRAECLLLDEPSREIEIETPSCPDFVHPNRDEAGYYRWRLPDAELRALAGPHLMQLAPKERVALASHAQALLEAGDLEGGTYVQLLSSLARDEHWLSLGAVISGIELLDRLLTDAQARRALSRWAHRTLAPHVTRVGDKPSPGEPAGRTLLRPQLLHAFAQVARDAATLSAAQRAARAFLGDPEAMPSDEARFQLALAARDGDAELHAALVRLVETTRSPQVRHTALVGLSHFESPELLRRSLDLLLDGPLGAQDYWSIVGPPSGRDDTHPVVWRWLTQREDELIERLGSRMAEQLPWLAAGACTPEARSTARAHFEADERLGPGASQNLEQALESSARCIELRRRHAASASSQLRSLSKGAGSAS